MTEVTPVVFKNRQHMKLFGILHEPDTGMRKSTAIVLLSPGVKMRVAPHGMYTKMARQYTAMGYPVLRFDFYGLGDAEGEIDMDKLSSVYNSIQLGRYVDDTIDSLDWLQKNYGISDFVVGGLCGGAITGMMAAENDFRIKGLLALGIPVTLDVGEENRHKHLSKGQLSQLRSGYIRNLFKWQSWVRLLTFKSDFRVLFKSIGQLFKRKKTSIHKTMSSETGDKKHQDDNINPRFAPAFLNMLETSRPMLHIFSGTDRLAWEFEEKFCENHREQLDKYSDMLEIHTIDKANHILAHPDWFNQMLKITKHWLARFN